MKTPAVILPVLFLCSGLLPISAVQTERVLVDSFADWAEGTPGGTAVVEPGRLVPALSFSPLAELKSATLWNGALEKSGTLLLATGNPGAVWRLGAQGRQERLTEFKEPDVYAVAAGPKGEIYAAPSPGGKIFRIGPKGQFVEYHQTGEEFVWDMVVSPSGVLYAATGTKGRIHRITAPGQGQVWFDADEPHIRRLAFDAAGNLLAGTAGKGLLYRIMGRDQAVVLLDSGRDEVAGLAVDATGRIGVAAVSTGGTSGSSDRPRSFQPPVSSESKPAGNGSGLLEPPRAGASSASSGPRGSTDIFVLQDDLHPVKLRELKDDVFSLAAVGDAFYAASAVDGQLYQIQGGRDFAYMGEIEGQSVVGMFARGDTLFALARESARVWKSGGGSPRGRYRSKVIDARSFADWGGLRLLGEGDGVVRTRSGNTGDADKSWYPWMPLDGGRIASPSARYLQFEIELGRGEVEQVEVFYLPRNQTPRIDTVRVLEPGTVFEPMSQPGPPPQPQSADQLAKGQEGPPAPPTRFQPSQAAGGRSVVWQASDPNGDRLRYAVHLKKEGESRWELLEEDLEHPVFSWDTSGWPDGFYRVKVRAEDSPDNPVERVLHAERTSEAITIDQTPPTVTVVRKTAGEVEIDAGDRTSRIAGAFVSENGHDFQPLLPVDGINDSERERYRAPRTKDRTLYFRVQDSHGNVTGLRVVPE